MLRRVLVQNTKVTTDRSGREVVTLRDADTDGLPSGRSRIVSPYDLDARWGGRRDLLWINGVVLRIIDAHLSVTTAKDCAWAATTGWSPP